MPDGTTGATGVAVIGRFFAMHRDMTRGVADLTRGGTVGWETRVKASFWFFFCRQPYRLDLDGWTVWESPRV